MLKFLVIMGLLSFLPSCQMTDKGPLGSELSSVEEVQETIDMITTRGNMEDGDIQKLFAATGNTVNHQEGMALFNFFKGNTNFKVPPKYVQEALDYALTWKLKPSEKAALEKRESLNGEPIPDKVIEILSWARLSGAIPYDVSTDSNFTPYTQNRKASGTLAYSHTQITPKSLKADMDDRTVGNKIVSTTNGVTYEKSDCARGRGDIRQRYDERSTHLHTDKFARGEACQKWANNCVIMFDGSLHCLPASRRDSQVRLILTNPSLGRGHHMLFNGHINAEKGVVTYVGMSGRIAKQAAKGNGKPFVDATKLIEAWGIPVRSGVRTVSEHWETRSDFAVHDASFTVRSRR